VELYLHSPIHLHAWCSVQAQGQLYIFTFTFSLGYGLDDRCSRVRFPAGLGIFSFTTASRTALGPTQPPIQWILSNAEVKECVALYLHYPNTPSWRGAQLKHRDYFTLKSDFLGNLNKTAVIQIEELHIFQVPPTRYHGRITNFSLQIVFVT
jgi:hypothetical protein